MNKRGGKFAVISGGAGGIGRSLALNLADTFFPIILDRDEDAGKKASAELQAAGFESEFYCAELRNERQVAEAFAEILAKHKQVDALVNLAGGTFHKKRIQDLTRDEWQEILDAV